VEGYGGCWHPTKVDCDWAPYTDGSWAYTNAGWTWASYEDFGLVVYHYGRWMQVQGQGWCWVPGYEWAPAWVSWRSNADAIGWAPLPPEARWQGEIGISVWVDTAYDIGPGSYNFCHIRDFGAPLLRGVMINREENFTLISTTTNITNITYNNFGGNRVVFNGGPSFTAVSAVVTHPIPTLTLVQQRQFNAGQLHAGGAGALIASRTVGNQLIVAAPSVSAPTDPNFFTAKATKTVPAGKVMKGWEGIKDPASRQQLKQKIQAQTKGLSPETTHAHVVAAAELQAVPSNTKPAEVVPSVGTPRVTNSKPATPPAAAVTKPAVPAVPAAGAQIFPRVTPPVEKPVEKPVAGPGTEARKPTTPTAEIPPAKKEVEVPPAKKEPPVPPASKEPEATPAKKPATPEKAAVRPAPTPHATPREESHPAHPTPSPGGKGKKGSPTPAKD